MDLFLLRKFSTTINYPRTKSEING